MADSICLGACLGLDGQDRIEVRADNQTIFCEDDGSGTGASHLVARGFDCDPWPFQCSPQEGGYKVYCDANGQLWAGPKPYRKQDVVFNTSQIPNINTLLQQNGAVLKELNVPITNDDPCCRPACYRLTFNWNGFGIEMPKLTDLYLNTLFTTNGWDTSFAVAGFGFANTSDEQGFFSPGGNVWTVEGTIQCGQTIDFGMRWATDPIPTQHFPNRPYAATPTSIYSIQADYELHTDC